MKILLIEDEQSLIDLLKRHFKREGYICEVSTNFQDSFKKINNYEYDCAIVDLNLPDGDGLQLVKLLRQDNPTIAIIIISARNEVHDKVSGLNTGADDYLTKPFSMSELNARIKAIRRRKTHHYNNELQFNNLIIKLDERLVFANGNQIKLTKKEYDILLFLARNKNRVVSKDSLAEFLWGDYMDDVISYDFIYAHVKNLRKKLSKNNCGGLLETIYGVGYKFKSV